MTKIIVLINFILNQRKFSNRMSKIIQSGILKTESRSATMNMKFFEIALIIIIFNYLKQRTVKIKFQQLISKQYCSKSL
jgi:NADH:ubiquinone oxidoreductase subunit 3 (subunit A)